MRSLEDHSTQIGYVHQHRFQLVIVLFTLHNKEYASYQSACLGWSRCKLLLLDLLLSDTSWQEARESVYQWRPEKLLTCLSRCRNARVIHDIVSAADHRSDCFCIPAVENLETDLDHECPHFWLVSICYWSRVPLVVWQYWQHSCCVHIRWEVWDCIVTCLKAICALVVDPCEWSLSMCMQYLESALW